MEEDWIREWTEEQFVFNQADDEVSDIRAYFDLGLFTKLQKTFMTATGMNGNILDPKGVAITDKFDDRSPAFCRLVQSVPEGEQRCLRSDERVTSFSITKKTSVVCKCHAGLYDSAVPIHFRKHGMGAFITGQVLLEHPTEVRIAEILKRVESLGLNQDSLVDAIRQVPVITEEKLKATTEFMSLLVEYIVKSLEEGESKRKEAEWRSLLRETEMKVIQAKLHPHFLFNILNLISGQALLENATQTYATVNHLSRMLRYIVKSYRPLVTIDEELTQLDSYIQLQLLRFEDRLSFRVDVHDERMKSALLPSLTLQILIENAIKHGVEPKEGPCELCLRVYISEDRGIIEIKDAGVGMDEQTVLELNEGGGEHAKRNSGIAMIRKRLDYYYEGNYELRFRSEPGFGTTVMITFPITENG
ncbi:sensor histidine kinase [Paenibacillus mendelii]|uniref:PocR ligand-binding domain-containing protein n=1 Tax=Paenibacillus mendelii TaxID=206163 RepID=A0ABV6J7B7_9BACL|nr:PocR ligand-binding domain-containing protein [Paenibacillus mendelii]MCQ6562120.1 PocR ligand-binding domain-containing protein [Paenibacillus mendelii]